MRPSPLEARIAEIIGPSVEDMGYVLVRVKMIGGREDATLQIMAERPDGAMEVDDCADISHAVSALLDVEDPIKDAYTLEVSSPGMDRPLTRPEDFDNFAGRSAKVETARMIDGRKRFKGVLKGRDAEGRVLIEGEGFGLAALDFEELAAGKLVIDEATLLADLKAGKAAAGKG